MNGNAKWGDAREIKHSLVADGWASPDTYSDYFAPVPTGPAVYLFLLHDKDEYSSAFVAYVGMSKRLSQRLATHNILPSLHDTGHWPMRWFMRVRPADLRQTEKECIERFDPPWNIVGRVRGVQFS